MRRPHSSKHRQLLGLLARGRRLRQPLPAAIEMKRLAEPPVGDQLARRTRTEKPQVIALARAASPQAIGPAAASRLLRRVVDLRVDFGDSHRVIEQLAKLLR